MSRRYLDCGFDDATWMQATYPPVAVIVQPVREISRWWSKSALSCPVGIECARIVGACNARDCGQPLINIERRVAQPYNVARWHLGGIDNRLHPQPVSGRRLWRCADYGGAADEGVSGALVDTNLIDLHGTRGQSNIIQDGPEFLGKAR